MAVQSLNYFSMAHKFLELKMGAEMSMTGNSMGRGQGQQWDTDILSGMRHMLGVKYLVCLFLPYFLFSYKIVQDEGQTTTLLHSSSPIRTGCSSEMWAVYETPCLSPAPSGNALCSLQHDQQKGLQMSAPRKSPSPSTRAQDSQLQPSPFSSWNNSTQTSSVSYSFLWLQ